MHTKSRLSGALSTDFKQTWNATVSRKQRYNALEAETERTPTVTKAAVKS